MMPRRRIGMSSTLGVAAAILTATAGHAQPPVSPQPATYSGTCPNGAPAREARYCRFFVHYANGSEPLPVMVGDFLGITQASQTRSIGLIIAIDAYPQMPGHDLSAAAVDAQRLQDFLVNNQRFDEVIVLRNADASPANIDYFLRDYLTNHADDYKGSDGQGRARLLVAYTGHGRAETNDAQAAFVLESATDPKGSTGIYPMTSFTNAVQHLAPHYFHVLTLINACFGANIFTLGNTGAAATPTAPGSFVMTAGSPQDEVQALIPKRGSLFFDLIINGVSRGEADPTASQYIVTDGTSTAQPDVTLTLSQPLQSYLTAAFFRINAIQKKANPHFLAISAPYLGPVQTGMAQGSFFFVSNRPTKTELTKLSSSVSPYLTPIAPGTVSETASIDLVPLATPISPRLLAPLSPSDAAKSLPIGPVSSIKGRPDIKIFKPPVVYPFKGYDLSAADGSIDWRAFAKSTLPQFIYARAVGWAGPDKSFSDHWTHAKALGIDRGAYLKFDFCRSTADQLNRLREVGGGDIDALPVAIELVTPTADQPQGTVQLACYKTMGIAGAQNAILDLAKAVATATLKVPLFKGNSYNLSILTDDRAQPYMIWLDAYGAPETLAERLKLRGRNPWTLWQYSHGLSVAGAGARTTGEVFFGTAAQYARFRRADVNVALAAVE
ncbi:GH25 family lysozyme [Sphingomonas sp. M6A6_1c]